LAARNIREDRTVNSFEELARLVQPFRKDGDWIFRGIRQSNYELIQKIGRPESRKAVGSGGNLPCDRKAEETMIRHFFRSAAPYVKHVHPLGLSGLRWRNTTACLHGCSTGPRVCLWRPTFAVEDARDRPFRQ
jgi:hypothetical protein